MDDPDLPDELADDESDPDAESDSLDDLPDDAYQQLIDARDQILGDVWKEIKP